MRKFHKLLFFLTITLIGFQSCTDVSDTLTIPSDLRIQNFIWKGLNLYYVWKTDVPDLADNRFSSQSQLNSYLNTKTDLNGLFQDLLNKPISKFPNPGEAIDRFSVMFSDYTVLENIFRGVTKNNGVQFKLYLKSGSDTDVFGSVRYIVPNSDASAKNINRGDIFYGVNGTPLTVDNYQSLLGNESYILNLADYDHGNITPNGNSVNLTKTQLTENPIYHHSIIPVGNHKVAYLVYNGFVSNYDSQLNTVFGQFATGGATDLVLDLRYNSGGSVQTSAYLASMITGQFNGQLYGKEQWNPAVQAYFENHSPKNLSNNFTNAIGNGSSINSMHLSTVYILTTKSTASASELVINGLRPYINVVQIGDLTTGKNAGSITLYDSPNFSKNNINPHHTYAMQPLVFKMTNKVGFGEYEHGLVPTVSLPEDLGNLGQLGDPNEPLLSAALGLISQTGRKMLQYPEKTFLELTDSRAMQPLGTDMYKDVPEELGLMRWF